MNGDPGQRRRAGRQGRGQRLPLAGRHLGHHAVEQHPAADQLDVVVPLAEPQFGELPHERERLAHQLGREALSANLGAQLRHPPAELVVAQTPDLGPELVGALHDPVKAGEARSADTAEMTQRGDHEAIQS